ncbi:Pxr1, partial [Ophiophagus hannah]
MGPLGLSCLSAHIDWVRNTGLRAVECKGSLSERLFGMAQFLSCSVVDGPCSTTKRLCHCQDGGLLVLEAERCRLGRKGCGLKTGTIRRIGVGCGSSPPPPLFTSPSGREIFTQAQHKRAPGQRRDDEFWKAVQMLRPGKKERKKERKEREREREEERERKKRKKEKKEKERERENRKKTEKRERKRKKEKERERERKRKKEKRKRKKEKERKKDEKKRYKKTLSHRSLLFGSFCLK